MMTSIRLPDVSKCLLIAIIVTTTMCIHCSSDLNDIHQSQTKLRKVKETNIFNFVRLIVLRMIYGFASMFGFGETLENFAGGFLVPPGVADSDYDGFGLLDDDYNGSDYDYS